MRRLYVLVFAGLMVSTLAAPGAYLEESDGSGDRRPIPPPPPPRIIPPHPQHGPALRSLVRQVVVGTPVARSGLTVFPLQLGYERRSGFLTLDEALRRGELAIREKGDGQVPWLLVRNESHRPVFLLSGEIVLGGKQNRIVRENVLLPARSEWIEVSVYCGEQNRWRGAESGFMSKGTLSAPSLRSMAAGAATQDNVWREIDGQLGRANIESSTRSYQRLYESEAVSRRLDACVAEFRHVPDRRTVGCVVVCGGRILGCDLLADADLFMRLWPKIIRSYATDTIVPMYRGPRQYDDRIMPVPPSHMVRQFLDGVPGAHFSDRRTPGLGRAWRVSGPVTGDDLEYNGEVVHAGLFPSRVWSRPTPMKGN